MIVLSVDNRSQGWEVAMMSSHAFVSISPMGFALSIGI